MRVLESQEPRVLGRTTGGEGNEDHGAIRLREHTLGVGRYNCIPAMRETGSTFAAATRASQPTARRLIKPDVRGMEKKVR
jgi:hypothetical protein